ncbi:MAG: GNAT family N-acetyltransferase [Sarcina sp.]
MEICIASIEDFNGVECIVQDLHNIHNKSRPDIYKKADNVFDKGYYSSLLKSKNYINLVAKENEEILGFASVAIKETLDSDVLVQRRYAYIDSICVKEGNRNLGIGAKIFEFIKEELKKIEIDSLELMVWEFNEDAIKFYENTGMKVKRRIFEMQL